MGTPTTSPELGDVLTLLTIPRIGPGRVRRLLSEFESADAVLSAPLKRLMRIEGIDEILARQIKNGVERKVAEQQLQRMQRLDIRAASIWDPVYPPLLKKTTAPPVLLFYKGTFPESWPPCIGVVGTRMPSQYGRIVTEKLVGSLASRGIAVISGLARGIDTTAHQTTLKQGGLTYAVLGCGVDYIYPLENKMLYQKIAQKGAVLSEYFIGALPDASHFPRRNRIISGMCLGVLVVEAGEKSGALITANFALEQNREVFAVPGNITSPKSCGPNRLIQQGAKLVNSVEDILDELAPRLTPQLPEEKPLPPNLDLLERRILESLSAEPLHIDHLVKELQESPAVVLSRLLTLELLGVVKQLSGKMFVRI